MFFFRDFNPTCLIIFDKNAQYIWFRGLLSLSPFFAVHIWVVPHPFFEICVRIRPCVLKAYTLSSTMRPLFVYRVMRNLTSSAHQAFNTNATLDIDFQQPLFCQTTHFQCTLIVYDVGRTIQWSHTYIQAIAMMTLNFKIFFEILAYCPD